MKLSVFIPKEKRNRRLGNYVNGRFVIRRTNRHYFRKERGFGINQKLADELIQKEAPVRLIYRNIDNGTEKLYKIKLKEVVKRKPIQYDIFDSKYIIKSEDMVEI